MIILENFNMIELVNNNNKSIWIILIKQSRAWFPKGSTSGCAQAYPKVQGEYRLYLKKLKHFRTSTTTICCGQQDWIKNKFQTLNLEFTAQQNSYLIIYLRWIIFIF